MAQKIDAFTKDFREASVTMLTLDEVLTAAGFTPAEQTKIRNHELVRGAVESINERELAARFAFAVRSEPSKLKEVFFASSLRQDADETVSQMVNIEDGDSNPFSSLKLEPNGATMTKAYLSAKPGSSGDLNLSKEEMAMFASLPSSATQADVEAKLGEVLLARLREYQQKGLKGIPKYSRGKTDFAPGEELMLKSEKAPVVQKVAPKFHQCLMNYPDFKPSELEESFSWVNFKIDDKPTIALVHKFGMNEGDVFVYCQRHFYVSRGHNSIQGVGGAFAVEDNEVVMIYASRTSTDQVAGFGGSAKRAVGARIMGGRIADNMENVRSLIEKQNSN
jgi:hypothetical protein